MFVIKSKNHNVYYQKSIFKNQYHFVSRIEEAKRMSEIEAIKILNKFNHSENYELIEVKRGRRFKKRA